MLNRAVYTVLTEEDVDDEGHATGQQCALRDGHTGVLQIPRYISSSCMCGAFTMYITYMYVRACTCTLSQLVYQC